MRNYAVKTLVIILTAKVERKIKKSSHEQKR